MLGLKLNHVSKRGQGYLQLQKSTANAHFDILFNLVSSHHWLNMPYLSPISWHTSIIHCAKFKVYTCSICNVVAIPKMLAPRCLTGWSVAKLFLVSVYIYVYIYIYIMISRDKCLPSPITLKRILLLMMFYGGDDENDDNHAADDADNKKLRKFCSLLLSRDPVTDID